MTIDIHDTTTARLIREAEARAEADACSCVVSVTVTDQAALARERFWRVVQAQRVLRRTP